MSSSVAPSASAWRASNTFVAVAWLPCGKPIDVPTATSVPSRIAAARRDVGRADADRGDVVLGGQPAAVLDERVVELRAGAGEWSIVLAMSRSVRVVDVEGHASVLT